MGFEKGENPNRPKKGQITKAEPIRSLSAIKRMKKLLEGNHRDYAILCLGLNSAFRLGDLLAIRYCDVVGLKDGGELEVREQKTGKVRKVNINGTCYDAIQNLINSRVYKQDDFLFLSKRGGPLTIPTVSTMVKTWAKNVGLKGRYSGHTLRKTFAYVNRVHFKVSLPILTKVLGHSSEAMTLEYMCIQDDEIKDVYQNVI